MAYQPAPGRLSYPLYGMQKGRGVQDSDNIIIAHKFGSEEHTLYPHVQGT